MKFKIEKGIPIPKPSEYGPIRFALRQMQVGDSILADEPVNQSLLYQKLKPRKFLVRRVKGGWRIWRTA